MNINRLLYGEEMSGLERLEERIENLHQEHWEELKKPEICYEEAREDPDFDNKCDAWREKEEEFDRRRGR